MSPPQQRPTHYRDAVIAHIMLQNASAAIDFYTQALGAVEVMRIAAPDGRVLHAEIAIEGSVLMLGDADAPFVSPEAVGGTTVALHVYVGDVDARVLQAVEAGREGSAAAAGHVLRRPQRHAPGPVRPRHCAAHPPTGPVDGGDHAERRRAPGWWR